MIITMFHKPSLNVTTAPPIFLRLYIQDTFASTSRMAISGDSDEIAGTPPGFCNGGLTYVGVKIAR